MSGKKINLEEILKSFLTVETMRLNNPDYTFNMVLSAMKEACRQSLELDAEEAEIETRDYRKTPIMVENYGQEVASEWEGIYYGVDKHSILDTIKQIE